MQHGRSREKRKRLLCFNDKTPFSSCADVSKYFLPCVIRRTFCVTSQLAKKPLKLIKLVERCRTDTPFYSFSFSTREAPP